MKKLLLILLFTPFFFLNGCTTIGYTSVSVYSSHLTVGAQIDDELIEHYADARIDKMKLGKLNNINVHGFNRMLVLTGQVQNAAIRNNVAYQVARVREVTKVYNYLTIGPPASSDQWFEDTYLTGKINSSLMFSKASHFHFDIITEKGVVYLLGKAHKDEERYVLKRVKKIDGVKKVIPIFVAYQHNKAPILTKQHSF